MMTGISSLHSRPFVVGFTGHRRLESEEKIMQILHEVIGAIQRDVSRRHDRSLVDREWWRYSICRSLAGFEPEMDRAVAVSGSGIQKRF